MVILPKYPWIAFYFNLRIQTPTNLISTVNTMKRRDVGIHYSPSSINTHLKHSPVDILNKKITISDDKWQN